MAPCLIAVNRVPEREDKKYSRPGCLDPVRPSVNSLMSDRIVRSSLTAVVTEDEEFAFIRRCVLFLLLVGFLPIITWLLLHIFYPDLLFIDITPKAEHLSGGAVTDRLMQ